MGIALAMMRIAAGGLVATAAVPSPAGAQQSPQDMNEFQLQVVHQLDDAQSVLAQQGYVQVDRRVDTRGLDETESHQWDLELEVGYDYVITAVCDSDCTDLDLIFYELGSEAARDTESNAYPILTASPKAERQQIEVTMYSCDVGPCYYGFSVFRNGEP